MIMPADAAPSHAHGPTRSLRRMDVAIGAALFAVTVLYCANTPYYMYTYDEGLYLYESKRLLDGEIFYRDVFEIVTPGAWYLMAAAYWLFGTTMATARTTMAVLHGILAVCGYAACRALGVRRSIATVAGLAQVAVWFLAVERAAPHWFGTLFCVFLLLFLQRRPVTSAARALVVGMLVGALIIIQQQRGVPMALAPGAVLLVDHWLLAPPEGVSWRSVLRCTAAYAGGVLLVVVPVLLLHVLLAGFGPVFDALVRYPLFNYRRINALPWWAYGTHNPFFDAYVGPIVKYLSLFAVGAATARCVWQWRTRRNPLERRPLLVTLIISLGAILGILYNATFPYVALVAPLWLPLAADAFNAALTKAEERWPVARLVGAAVLGGLVLVFAVRLEKHMRELRANCGLSRETPFGRLNFCRQADLALMSILDDLTEKAPSREMFIYPWDSGLYLLTGTDNPTRFQVVIPGYTDPEHIQEAIRVLEAHRVPLVIRVWLWLKNDTDPFLPYLKEHYEAVKLPYPREHLLHVYRRKPEPASGGGQTSVAAPSDRRGSGTNPGASRGQ
jgi:hypothetical protein